MRAFRTENAGGDTITDGLIRACISPGHLVGCSIIIGRPIGITNTGIDHCCETTLISPTGGPGLLSLLRLVKESKKEGENEAGAILDSVGPHVIQGEESALLLADRGRRVGPGIGPTMEPRKPIRKQQNEATGSAAADWRDRQVRSLASGAVCGLLSQAAESERAQRNARSGDAESGDARWRCSQAISTYCVHRARAREVKRHGQEFWRANVFAR